MQRWWYVSLAQCGFAVLVTALPVFGPPLANAQSTQVEPYGIGDPTLSTIWVDVNNGSDSNSGNSSSTALQSITAAWNKIPSGTLTGTGYTIKIRAGSYAESLIPNYWENKRGTAQFPIILEAVDGAGTAILLGDINAYNIHHFYLLGLSIIPGGDTFHCELCEHVLLREVNFDGEDSAHETIKINQSSHIYIEDSTIKGAGDNAIDFVAVQYGHIINSRVSNASDWCVYVKGGSAYITFANNSVFSCGTGGFTAGQGTGLEFMTHPWTRYEAYSIKAFNNLFYNIEGASLGVNGGMDVLIAYNTSYRIGTRSHVFEAVFGLRSCDGNSAGCAERVAAAGWGPASTAIAEQNIPNKNVYVYNNIFYNPAGVQSLWQHLAIYAPRSTLAGTNIPSPAHVDDNLVIKRNIIWNGTTAMPVGVESDAGCNPANTSCNLNQLVSDNSFNQIEPEFADPANNDYRPLTGGNLFSYTAIDIPEFTGAEHSVTPATPQGINSNSLPVDLSGVARASAHPIGAYSTSDGALVPTEPGDSGDTAGPDVTSVTFRPSKNLRPGSVINVRVSVSDASEIILVRAKVGPSKIRLKNVGGTQYSGKLRLSRSGNHVARIIAKDASGNTTVQVQPRRIKVQ